MGATVAPAPSAWDSVKAPPHGRLRVVSPADTPHLLGLDASHTAASARQSLTSEEGAALARSETLEQLAGHVQTVRQRVAAQRAAAEAALAAQNEAEQAQIKVRTPPPLPLCNTASPQGCRRRWVNQWPTRVRVLAAPGWHRHGHSATVS